MAILIPAPHKYFAGNNIRKARKQFSCDGWSAKSGHRKIEPGEYYAEGDHDIDHANGFGRNRYCYECADVPLLLELNAMLERDAQSRKALSLRFAGREPKADSDIGDGMAFLREKATAEEGE